MSLNKRRKRAILKARKKMLRHEKKWIRIHANAITSGFAEGLTIALSGIGQTFSAIGAAAEEAAENIRRQFTYGKTDSNK